MSLAGFVEACAARPKTVLALWGAGVALAVANIGGLPVDAMPDVTNVQVGVITAAPSLSAREVEQYLTFPVEMAMRGLPKVAEIRSVSRAGVSLVTVVFEDAVDLWFARQQVGERLSQAEADMPQGYGSPELAPVSSALGKIFELTLSSPTRSPTELRTLMDWEVAVPLRGVPGVIEVNAMGGLVKQVQVIARPRRLTAFGLGIRELVEALRNNNLNVGSGYIEVNEEARVVRGEGQLQTLDDIANVGLAADVDGTPVVVRNVAQVIEGAALPFGAVTQNGSGEVVSATVMMLVGANTRAVLTDIRAKVQEISAVLPADVSLTTAYDRSDFIDRTLHTVFSNLLEAGVGVLVLLLLFLGGLVPALIAALAIPSAMALTTLAMRAVGISGNIMSLGAIDFGLLVDGAIVMLEAALVAIGTAAALPAAERARRIGAAMGASARAVVFALSIILLVYLPLMALEGSEGKMFRPMSVTIALALAFALAFSLTAVPALGALFLRPAAHSRVWSALEARYRRALSRLLRGGGWAALALGLLGAGTAALAAGLGAEFLPRIDEGDLLVQVRRAPSIALSEARRLGEAAEQALLALPEVAHVLTRTGRAEVATDPVGADEADILVRLHAKARWPRPISAEALGDKVKQAIESQVPATYVAVSQPIEDSVNQMLAGSRADVAIKIFGPDLQVLKAEATRVAEQVARLAGTADLRVQQVLGLPVLNIAPDRRRLARYGLSAAEVLEVVAASRQGVTVGRIFENERRFDLTVVLPPPSETAEGMGALQVGTKAGHLLPLAALADISETEGPASITRENLRRRVMVEVNVRGRDLVSWVAEAREKVGQMTLAEGLEISFGGQFANFERAKARLTLVVPAVVAVIFTMLLAMFGHLGRALSVSATVAFAAVGGVAALWARQMPFSIPAAVGFIAVGGVSVLNGVVMASRVALELAGGAATGDAVRRGAAGALRPMLTTAAVAVAGFLPMAVASHTGSEVQRPLATVVIGGILSSTALTLTILPLLLSRGRRA